ncbi:MAG: hypothetical protein KH395_12240 [Bacteroides sp.]|nr:hypothetical protein [Bacteroides sp.]DAW35170.1 MAG TPA: hypothetical protein [Caudoviricetes sp.]
MPTAAKPSKGKQPKEGDLDFTAIFMRGLKAGVPWAELCRMTLPTLLMMLGSTAPKEVAASPARDGEREATQADIQAFFG